MLNQKLQIWLSFRWPSCAGSYNIKCISFCLNLSWHSIKTLMTMNAPKKLVYLTKETCCCLCAWKWQNVFLIQIDYVSLADVRIIKHGHSSDLATVVASSDALVTPTKATNSSTNEKLSGDQTAVGSCKSEREGPTPAKGNLHFTILGVYLWCIQNNENICDAL